MKNIYITFISALFFMSIHAQKAIVVSGGDIANANYTVSYSIGQVSQQKVESSGGLLNQGVQQPFEIFSLQPLGVDQLPNTTIDMVAYPNPTVSFINLSISRLESIDATYSLFDLQGKLLISTKINAPLTKVEMGNYPVSTYFLRVQNKNGEVLKTFKIIKN